MRFKLGLLLGAAMFAAPSAAWAQTDGASDTQTQTVEDTSETPRITFSANAGIVSDYRFRGLSLSNRNPAIQGGFDIAMDNGLFIGTWASSVADTGGSNVEVDIYGGYSGSAAGLDYTVTALAYLYPGGSGVDYYEFSAAVEKSIGPATVGVLTAYVPDQTNFPGDNLYISGTAGYAVPNTPISISARLGREASAVSKKWDWEAGISYDHGPFATSLSYVDSDAGGPLESGRLGQSGVVASVTASF